MKRVQKYANGLCISWEDSEPETDKKSIVNARITHDNPTLGIIMRQSWKEGAAKAFNEIIPMRWAIKITGVFRCGDDEEHDIRELEAHTILCRINDVALEQIADLHSERGGEYVTTKFELKCVGF
jgi:hypothetical protein